MVTRESAGEKVFKVFNYILLTIFALSTLYPFHEALIKSLNDGWDAMKGGLYLLPRVWTLDNYKKAFEDTIIFNAFGVSIFRTVVGTTINVVLTGMAAYALARKDLPGKRFITFFFFLTTIFYGGMIPTYLLLRTLHLTGNIWVYILPNIFAFIYIVFMRSYFETLPDELRESATLDGCGELRMFMQIYVPLSLPMIATITLFYGVGHWNDWFFGAYYINKPSLKPAATVLYEKLSQMTYQQAVSRPGTQVQVNITRPGATTPDSVRMAFLMVITLPIVCIYPFLQKYFVKGITLGAVKQ